MAVLKGRRAGGHPVSIVPVTGTAPSQIGSFVAGTPASTTIPVTYTAASGTAPISYSGQTSLDNSTWTSNSGTFTGLSATFSGLTASTAYYLRIIATNAFGSSTTVYGIPSTVTTSSAAASAYTVAISPASGLSGSTFSYTATPATGGWPSGEIITPTVTGGTASPTSATGSGTTPVVFTISATGSGGTNCIVNSSAPGMTNLTGAETYAITNPATLSANRYDIIPSASSGSSGTASVITIYPNGVWGGGTLTLAATNGTFNPSATLTLPSSGNTAQTVTWTPSAVGEVTITGTNTASMHNPLGAYYTVFASSAGTARSLSAGGSYFLDQQPFQQDVWSGTPTGFSAAGGATLGMGWGIFQIQATTGGTSAALYGQLFDSDSSGATTSAGTGTAVTNAAQIYGPVGGGAFTVNVLLPASDVTYYLDIATDGAMTNRARIPLRFRITDVVAIMSRSMECAWLQTYPYSSPPGNLGWSSYTKTMLCGAQNTAGSSAGVWVRADGVTQHDNAFASWGSVGSQEAGRRFFNRKGHGCALVGIGQTGGSTDAYIASDGSPCSGFTEPVSHCNNKFRYLKTLLNEWTGSYVNESYAEYQTIYNAFVAKMPALYPALAVMAVGISSGQFGHNGSMRNDAATPNTGSMVGYTRVAKIITDQIEPVNPMVSSADAAPDWHEWLSGHATWASQTRYVRNGSLAMLMADGAYAGGYGLPIADRYAKFATTGTISGNDLRIPFTLPAGATALVAKKWGNGTTSAGWTYSTPTAAELRNLVSVFPLGQNDSTGRPIVLTGVAIDNTNKWLVLTLSRTGGAGTIINFDNTVTSQPSSLTVHLMSDFNDYNDDLTIGVGIFDDRTSLDDFGFGPHVRPQLDIVVS